MNVQDKGTAREIKTAAYFQGHGFFVRQGVKLAVAAGTADITDIDVLALRFNIPLAEERLVIDCKDRKKPRPFERVLWTIGLSTSSHANRSVIVLPSTPWQVREFAAQANVEVLCVPEVDKYLESIKSSTTNFGEADSKVIQRFESIRKKLSDKGKLLLREDVRARQMLVRGHSLTNLNRLIQSLSIVGKLSPKMDSETEWLRHYICFNTAIIASVMLIRFAIETKWTPEDDWSDYARKKLTYGDVPPQKAKQLAKLALDREFYGGLPKPLYTEEIIQVLRILISNPVLASLVPYALDYYLLGRIFSETPNNYVSPVLGELQTEAFKVCKQILSVLAYAAEISNEIWILKEFKAVDTTARKERQERLIKG